MVVSRSLRFGAFVLVLASLLASACSLVGDDKDGGSSKVKVTQGVFASQLDQNGQAVNPSNVFAAGTKQINAVLLLEGVSAGNKITARWYQLNVKDAPAGGAEVNSAVSTLEKDQIQDGKVVLRFSQASNNGLPNDSWQLRVFEGGTLIKTMGFVIANVQASAPPPASPPPPAATPAFTNYTVVSGDTLQSVAIKLKPPAEDVQAFTTRLVQANNLQPNATLTTGQVLRVPR